MFSKMDSNDFKGVVKLINNGLQEFDQRVKFYNRAANHLNAGVSFQSDTPIDTKGTNISTSLDNDIINLANLDYDFSRIATNIQNLELDETEVSWGSRSTQLEESDFIGLKQYILYLMTRFYPQRLIPFIELVPVFSVANGQTELTTSAKDAIDKKLSEKDLAPEVKKNILEKITSAVTSANISDSIIDERRFDKTQQKLQELLKTGGTDLTVIDPFLETTSEFNILNEEGKNFYKKRNISAKVFSSLVFSPSIEEGLLSKPGDVGLKSVEISSGSQDQSGMSLITISLLDIQGNKFLDPNSPWSFILNLGSSIKSGDFLFRYGWQFEIPTFDSSNIYKGDINAKGFWNHPGWNLFSALVGEGLDVGDNSVTIKTFISNLALTSNGVLTFSQSINPSSFTQTGYNIDDGGNFIIKRDIENSNNNYLKLTLINPQIDIDPKTGAITATLVFRTNSAVANCLCPLAWQNSPYETQSLVKESSFTLAQLFKAFINDNQTFNRQISTQQDNSLYFNVERIDEWLTVIGGVGSDGLNTINPNDIKLTISQELKDELLNANAKDTRLLIEWLNQALGENNMTMLSAADYGQQINGGQGFVVVYDTDKASAENGTEIKGNDLAKKDPSFGDFLNYSDFNSSSDNFVGKRLYAQDDVCAFRFKGSLVEELKIDKLESPNASKYQALNDFSSSQGENVDNKSVTPKTEDVREDKVSIRDKKRNLQILLTSMTSLKVKMIGHPWLKLARPIYVKGSGFWDGKYTITKITHSFETGNKFYTELLAYRVLPPSNKDKVKQQLYSEKLQNNPAAKAASSISLPNYTVATAPLIISTQSQINPDFLSIGATPINGIQNIQNANRPPKLRTELEQKIVELHPAYQDLFRIFISRFESTSGYTLRIVSGYRSFAVQANLKDEDKRNAKPGYSMHNYGLAIDVHIYKNGKLYADKTKTPSGISIEERKQLWINTGIVSIAKSLGLTWGGDFEKYKDDVVHFGLDGVYGAQNQSKGYGWLLAMAKSQFGPDLRNAPLNRISLSGRRSV